MWRCYVEGATFYRNSTWPLYVINTVTAVYMRKKTVENNKQQSDFLQNVLDIGHIEHIISWNGDNIWLSRMVLAFMLQALSAKN